MPSDKPLWSKRFGTGAPLVLIHGMGSSHTAWRLITPELSRDYQIILIDLPGHGEAPISKEDLMDPQSLSERVLSTLRAIGVERFHLVGNSLGGWIALELASAHPESVMTVTALAPAGLWLVPETHRIWAAAQSRHMAKLLHPIAPLIARFHWAKKLGFASVSPLWEELPLQVCVDATRAMGTSDGYFPAWDGLLGRRFESQVSPEIPVTVIFGDTDNTLPATFSQERSLAPAHSRWVVLSQCGHAPMWDHPSEVMELIRETTRERPL